MQKQHSKKGSEIKYTSVSWKQQCLSLLDNMLRWEDSAPFRYPVNLNEYPDYRHIIDCPMDLSTVEDKLRHNHYKSPIDLCKDVRLIFQNSRNYNTNRRSWIYSMTTRISAMFEEHFRSIMSNWSCAVNLEEKLKLKPYKCFSSVEEEEIPSIEGGAKPKISTLVFMDLETTGLPFDVGKENVQITEMSMVAIDRLNFENDANIRVLNKISLCVQPRFEISPGATDVSGLCNEMLENQLEFDDTVPPLLECFFRRLKKPICLLAHNGNRFDFPILQAELNRINYTLDPDIMCGDTMTALRAVCLLVKQVNALEAEENAMKEKMHAELVQQIKNHTISGDSIKSSLFQDLGSCINAIDAASVDGNILECGLPKVSATNNKPENDTTSEKEPVYEKFLSPSQNAKAPQNLPLHTASDLSGSIIGWKRKVPESTSLPRKKYKYSKKKMMEAKRKLVLERDHDSLELLKITSFALKNLYKHFFHENPPNSHRAEFDCINLSKVCQKVRKNFLNWIDENSVAFSSVKALW